MKQDIIFKGYWDTMIRQGASEVVCSSFTRFEAAKKDAPGYGIKYVSAGKERYIVNGHSLDVREGQYLLLNKGQSFECNFHSDTQVQGCCITLDEELLSGIYHSFSNSEATLLDNPRDTVPSFPGVHELVYTRGNCLGSYIQVLHRQALAGTITSTPYELFYSIAIELLRTQADVNDKMTRLSATKLSTKKELFARLETARQLLEECKDASLKIQEVAQEAALSEFHFYRSFKAVYGVSPHQFLLRKKIERAAVLITEESMSMTDIAYLTGFNDIYSFSRAFRQQMNMSPSSWRSNNVTSAMASKNIA